MIIRKLYMLLKRKRLHKTNIFDKSNYIGYNTTINNTRWGGVSGVGDNSIIYNADIGNYVNIADGVKIGMRDHLYQNFTITDVPYNEIKYDNSGFLENRYRVSIGNDVWIGANVFIADRVKIGNGCVIGAGAVVTHSIPDYSIVGGNPSRIIKKRFSEEIIKRLEEIKWYLKPLEEVKAMKAELEKVVDFDIESYFSHRSTYKSELE